MRLKTGTILLFNWDGKSFWSRTFIKLIRHYNRLKYGKDVRQWTHAGIVVGQRGEDVLVYEAVSSGFTGPDNWYWKPAIIKDYNKGIAAIGETFCPLKKVKYHADKYAGRDYAWQDIISIGLSSFFRIPIGMTGAKRLICSEAIARILYDASDKTIDFEVEYGKPYDWITPIDLRESMQIEWEVKRV